ncbi:thiamine biosynthesis protein ApbE [Paramagnetospirillum marisnigri]|uniref:FAD:protein FMN transferase n=1 Tax=Paramagnetospirillum marisnigri TaxID=1285242 RepID=A0A178MT91_9PROT|nr:FAD:protein FMN transferase [Paramagnetospirillum marisnigri]OAN52734.1 thiamine biosynthesis protein ApbE [Paramagnetospirillum marisnigri]
MTVRITRRRAITVLAAAAGLPLLLKANRAEARLYRWEGTTLGAPSSISLYHTDEAKARAAVTAALGELARLEAMFSVYRADSSLSALNRDGKLDNAPVEFIEMIGRAKSLAAITGGVYDPTIQPVWSLYFSHFTQPAAPTAAPAERDLAAALALVDWRGIEIDAANRRVSLARPGMAVTLNSGAQGYITDKVAEVLRAHGFANMLVDMGEPRALATKPDGSAWRIGIANPADPSRAVTEIDVVDKAVSTSGGYGTLFDDAGKFTHLIDPRTGQTAPALLGVSVVAETAAVADGLSTAMVLAPVERRQQILRDAGGLSAIFVTPDGVAATVTA